MNKGFSLLKLIIILALVLLVASYFFNFSLKKAIESEQTQENFSYVSEQSQNFYTKHLKNTFDYLWYDVFVDLLWNSFIDNMGRIQEGGPAFSEEVTSLINPEIFNTGAPQGTLQEGQSENAQQPNEESSQSEPSEV
ncbi:MAG: hypothetical protein PHC89_00535 [Candidatus Pacebacteria bacterium]|nr:hypothetical protein [Candidatus Paceibacterota bacterium]